MEPAPPPPSHPAVAIINRIATEVAGLVLRRPVSVSVQPTVAGIMRGRVDEVSVTVSGVLTSGLIIERLTVVGRQVRIRPGVPLRILADEVLVTGRVTEDAASKWLTPLGGPVRVRMRPDGLGLATTVGPIRVSEVLTGLSVEGRFLRLRPSKASVLGVDTPLLDLVSGTLPLPPLTRGAKLDGVVHGDGWVDVTLNLGPADQAIDAGLVDRLRERFLLG